jgi:hypothetical protein
MKKRTLAAASTALAAIMLAVESELRRPWPNESHARSLRLKSLQHLLTLVPAAGWEQWERTNSFINWEPELLRRLLYGPGPKITDPKRRTMLYRAQAKIEGRGHFSP